MNALVAGGAIALTVPFLVVLGRDWVVRHLAVRYLRWRPVETALLVLGALFGTAIITASFVVGDTLDWSIRRAAFTELGEIDEIVTTRDRDTHALLQDRLEALSDDDRVDGVLAMVSVPASVRVDGAGGPDVAPRARVMEIDFEAAQGFGSNPADSGIVGTTPTPGTTIVSERLADVLDLVAGDEITVFVLGDEFPLEVTGVLAQRGIVGFGVGLGDLGRNVFVSPGTLDMAAVDSGSPAVAAAIERSVVVSNRGDVLGGVDLSDDVVELVQSKVADLGSVVRPLKADLVTTAEETSDTLGSLFFAMGVFGALAGVLLVVNLFVMLAEERKTQLGMFRALGMTRGALVRAFSVEGWLVGLVAAVIGAVAGLGLGRLLVALVARSIGEIGSNSGLDLIFRAEWVSIRDGFLLGLAVSTATIVVASIRFARVNIISAIRDLPAPPRTGATRRAATIGVVVTIAGIAWTTIAFRDDEAVGIVLAPLVAAVGLFWSLPRVASLRVRGTVLAICSIGWATIAIRIVAARVEEPDINAFVVQGVVLTGATVAMLALHQHRLATVAGSWLRGPRSLVLSLGIAHPLSRPVRTALTVGMYALVVFTLTFITVLSAIFTNQLDEATDDLSGGFDLLARSVAGSPLPLDEIAARDDVGAVAPLTQQPILIVDPDGQGEPSAWLASTFDERLIEGGPPTLRERGDFETAEAAYQAVLDDPRLVIIDPLLASMLIEPLGRVEVGSTLMLVDPSSGTSRLVEVAAFAPTDLALNGVLLGSSLAPPGVTLPPTRALVAAASGHDPDVVASDLLRDYAVAGAEVETIQSIVDSAATAESNFFELAQGYLALGMIVGVAGLSVVLVRAVRERRRQIGVLRSLGVQSGPIAWSFIVEAGMVSMEGVVIGVALAILTSYNIITSTTLIGLDVDFTLPVLEIAVLVALVVAASLVMTIIPARRAARIQPAVALRIAD